MGYNESFTGFPREMIDFLWELRFNNNKEWFNANRDRYKLLLKEPMDAFAAQLGEEIYSRTGKIALPSVSRINRDVRFSKNKAPYRDNKWIVFKRETGAWTARPVIFFELGPDYYMVGMGIYESLPVYLKAFRKKVDANTPYFERLAKKYNGNENYKLDGDFYKKKLGDKSEDVMQWYQRKAISLVYKREIDSLLFERELIDFCAGEFEYLTPLVDFFDSIMIE